MICSTARCNNPATRNVRTSRGENVNVCTPCFTELTEMLVGPVTVTKIEKEQDEKVS